MILKKLKKNVKRKTISVIAADVEGNELLSIFLENKDTVTPLTYEKNDNIAKIDIQFEHAKNFCEILSELQRYKN